MLEAIFFLLCAHALADFALQNDFMGKFKNRNNATDLPENLWGIWPYVLTSHALIHGLAVYAVFQDIRLALAETVAHWVIDFGKGEGWYGIHIDQWLHLACKTVWLYLAIQWGLVA